MDISYDVDKSLVKKTETCKILDMSYVSDLSQELIILPSHESHERTFLCLILDAENDFVSLFPFMYQSWDELGRILEIRIQADHAVTHSLLESVNRRPHLAEVSRIENGLNMPVFFADAPDDPLSPVLRMVVNKNYLIIILRQLTRDDPGDGVSHRLHVFFLVIAGDDDRNQFLFLFHISGNLSNFL